MPDRTIVLVTIAACMSATPVAATSLPRRVVQLVAQAIGVDRAETIDTDAPMVAIGLDSLQALELRRRVKIEFDRDLEVSDQPLDVAVNQLREQTGINLVIDQAAGPGLVPGAAVMPGLSPYWHTLVTARSAGRPVREALAKALRPHGLTVVVVGDTALVTTPEKAVERQLSQAVHLDADGAPAVEQNPPHTGARHQL